MPKLKNWKTELTNIDSLYLCDILDKGTTLCFTVEDGNGIRYEVIFKNQGPYRVTDEQHLLSYWDEKKEKDIGWTFIVKNETWSKDLELLDIYFPKATCYVIATYDCCLEILTENEPKIRKM